MDKSLKIAKLNIKYLVKYFSIFYCFSTAFLMFIVGDFQDSNVVLPGIQAFTIFYMMAAGIGSFKPIFHFSQNSNVSRKSLIKGITLSIIPVALVISTIDVLINRGVNAFIKSPTVYDVIYGNYKGIIIKEQWIQDNSFAVIINTILFLFMAYTIGYIIGVVVNIIYYRCNNIMKVVLIAAILGGDTIVKSMEPRGTNIFFEINQYFKTLLNLSENNILPILITFALLYMILYFVAILLTKKITMKKS